MNEAYLAPLLPPDQATPLRQEASVEAKRALALDPSLANAYVAQEEIQPLDHWADRERLLRQGLAADPTWPNANGFLGMMLADSGRMNEALLYTRRPGQARQRSAGRRKTTLSRPAPVTPTCASAP
jgi:hypothetical protein